MDDVLRRRRHLQADRNTRRCAQPVDRDDAVRILVLPVKLPTRDAHFEWLFTARTRGGNVGNSGQLVEDEASDQEEDDDRSHRPHELDTRRAMDLRPVVEALPPLPPVAPDESDKENLDEDEDRDDEDRDEDPGVVDPLGVGRLRRHRREPAVARNRRRYGCQRENPETCGEKDLALPTE
jgi:hypothetical protein